MKPSATITTLLAEIQGGHTDAASELMPLIYARLRRTAASCLAGERAGHTLQPSDLVQDVCLHLMRPGVGPWKSRQHFYAVASRAMRRALVDHARAKLTQKRDAEHGLADRPNATVLSVAQSREILALEDALLGLSKVSPRASRVVELRYFAGLSLKETAAVLHVGITTVKEEWTFARAWLLRELGGQ
jgi:RNA polymerase sigma-70 factor (ECF subfamily)